MWEISRPLTQISLYAYTEVEADEKGPYLLKVQGDDNIIVWVNGEKVVAIAEKGPPIRTAREVEAPLRRGRNRILFRLNQKKDQWQASVRIRATGDGIADVRGAPFENQSAPGAASRSDR